MADRRCFSRKIVRTDAFLSMPLSTQALYFHLVMEADDSGFVGNVKMVVRMIGASEDDLKLLITKRFILVFECGVVVIKHWRMMNTLKSDRGRNFQYPNVAKQLYLKSNGSYTEKPQENATPLVEHFGFQTEHFGFQTEHFGFQTEHFGTLTEEKRVEENLTEPNLTEVEVEGRSDDNENEKKLETDNGKLGQGKVMLSSEQEEDLLHRLSLDEYNYYVKKLAQFLTVHPNATVKSHYKTILKWAKEDRELI